MNSRIGSILLTVAILLFMIPMGQWMWAFVISGDPRLIGISIALLVLCSTGLWALWMELRFGRAATRLGRQLEDEDALPVEEIRLHPSGRPYNNDAEALFPKYRDAVEASPEDWRAWYRLGLVYDGAGDRRRARASIRKAIRLHKPGPSK